MCERTAWARHAMCESALTVLIVQTYGICRIFSVCGLCTMNIWGEGGGSKPSQLTGDNIFLIVYNVLYNTRFYKLRVNSSGRMLVDDALERI